MDDVIDRTSRAVLYWKDGEQFVRLPKEMHIESKWVSLRREGDTVFIEPVDAAAEKRLSYWEEKRTLVRERGPFSDDMVDAIREDRRVRGDSDLD